MCRGLRLVCTLPGGEPVSRRLTPRSYGHLLSVAVRLSWPGENFTLPGAGRQLRYCETFPEAYSDGLLRSRLRLSFYRAGDIAPLFWNTTSPGRL